jgi:hypothetical protein
MSTRIRLVYTRRLRFLNAECAFYTHEGKFHMMRVNMTLTSVSTTRSSMILLGRMISTRSVISTGTNVIPTCTSVIQSVVSTHTRAMLIRMRVNMTLTSMIMTCTIVISTRRV